ncbi:MAG: Rieske 2Fe-2S domain-containing protein [Bdellovibrionota bacterium]
MNEVVPKAPKHFVPYPASWYPFCQTKELGSKPVRRKILGRELVAFRSESGRVAVMDAYCSHMGADLGNGCIKGETISCPYHGWTYGQDGQCTQASGNASIPAFAKQRTYPAREKYGLLFFFNGDVPTYDIPFFEGENENDFLFGGGFSLEGETPWFMLGSHAFDEQHLHLVHARHLLTELKVDRPHPLARRATHTSHVCGEGIYDRLIRFFLGKRVEITMTVFSGTFIMVTGDFKNARSRFFLMATPLDANNSRLDGLIFSSKKGPVFDRLFAKPGFAIRRFFTYGYLAAVRDEIGHHAYNPHRLTTGDAKLVDYFNWVHEVTSPPVIEPSARFDRVPLTV